MSGQVCLAEGEDAVTWLPACPGVKLWRTQRLPGGTGGYGSIIHDFSSSRHAWDQVGSQVGSKLARPVWGLTLSRASSPPLPVLGSGHSCPRLCRLSVSRWHDEGSCYGCGCGQFEPSPASHGALLADPSALESGRPSDKMRDLCPSRENARRICRLSALR